VESAQNEVVENTKFNFKHFRADLDIYKEGSFDTATWLYHLVFSPQVPSAPVQDPPSNTPLYQASVSEEGAENAIRLARSPAEPTHAPPISRFTEKTDETVIVWGRQTEPSSVVDRLLTSWTTLTQDQISLSSIRQNDDGWQESFRHMVEQAKDEGELTFEKWDREYSSDDSDKDYFESAGEKSVVNKASAGYRTNRPSKDSLEDQAYFNQDTERYPQYLGPDQHHKSKGSNRAKPVKLGNKRRSDRTKADEVPAAWQQDPWSLPNYSVPRTIPPAINHTESRHSTAPNKQTSVPGSLQENTIHSTQTIPVPIYNPANPTQLSNPFIRTRSFGNDLPHRTRLSPYSQQGPALLQPPEPWWPYFPPEARTTASNPPILDSSTVRKPDNVVASETTAKEEAILAAVANLINNPDKRQSPKEDDPRFSKLLQLLVTQQEQSVQADLDRAKAVAGIEMKQILAARDQDDAKIHRLEKLIIQQREDQQKAEAIWRAEKAALDEKAARQTQEAKELVEREIAAARSAKKAAQKSLKFAKAEAE
jgi:hypothetical protein